MFSFSVSGWRFIYCLLQSSLHVPAHLTFDKTGLNNMCLYSKAIFVDQDCLLFLTPKNLSEVVFPPIYSGLKCFPIRLFLAGNIYFGSFCIFDLDLFQSPSTVKYSSSSVKVNLPVSFLNLTVCPLLVFVILPMEMEAVAEYSAQRSFLWPVLFYCLHYLLIWGCLFLSQWLLRRNLAAITHMASWAQVYY